MPMRVEIITAEREVYSDDVDVLTAPGVEGELGILPNHAPLMTALQPGEIMLRRNGEETYLAVTGGFMEVIANRVMILADACERGVLVGVVSNRPSDRRLTSRASDSPSRLRFEAPKRPRTLPSDNCEKPCSRSAIEMITTDLSPTAT